MRNLLFWVATLWTLPALAAERAFNLSDYPLNEPPPGFRSTVAGLGRPGDWKVAADEAPALVSSNAPAARPVLGQFARDPTANHFPLLIFEQETFRDFRLTTRLKITGGAMEQLAGVVFRFQNESNYCVAAANILRGNVCCYRILKGEIKPLLGQKMEVSGGDWHTLGIQCEGNRVVFLLDDNEPIKLLVDGPATGQIGFWTKSDTVAAFADTKITYVPRLILAQTLVNDALKEYPKVLDLQIFAAREAGKELTAIAAKDANAVGQPGGKTEQDAISSAQTYYARAKVSATVTIPLQDRNGEPIAAARVVLKVFSGQTEDNIVIRARTVVRPIQARVHSLEELLQ